MGLFFWITGVLLSGIWLWRLADSAMGLRSVPDLADPEWAVPQHFFQSAPPLTIVVPARNEQENIEACLRSLLSLDYPNYEIVAVDDRSSDQTGAIMDRLRADEQKLRVIHIARLPTGWLGKTHAMWKGAAASESAWILFTDGDVFFRADALSRAIAYAEGIRTDLVAIFPTMLMETLGEKMMFAFFETVLLFAYRSWKVHDPKSWDYMGVGAFNLIRREVYEAIGTFSALKLCVIEDMELARAVKKAGFAQRNPLAYGLMRMRWAKSAMGVVGNLTKNLFAVTGYHLSLAIAATSGLIFLNIWPFVGLLAAKGWQRLPFAVTVLIIRFCYVAIARRLRISANFFLAHPIAGLLASYTMLRSAAITLFQGGIVWRGTKYSLDELRSQARN